MKTTRYFSILLLAAFCWTSCGNDKSNAKSTEADLKEMRTQLEAKRNELSDKQQIAQIEAEMKELDQQIKAVDNAAPTTAAATPPGPASSLSAPYVPSGAMGTIKGLEVIMRAEASVKSDKISSFNQGEQVEVLETKNVNNENEAVLTTSLTLDGTSENKPVKMIVPRGKAVMIENYNADKNEYTVSYQDDRKIKFSGAVKADAIETIAYSTWYRVKRHTGKEGWVLGKFLKPNE